MTKEFISIRYQCPNCSYKITDSVPGIPKRINVRRYYCKECLVELKWSIKKNGQIRESK